MKKIEDNEKRLDKLSKIVSKLNSNLASFEDLIQDYYSLNEYYGSKEWFQDKNDFESGKLKNIKAGVLSEDAVWNLDENINDLIIKMEEIIKLYKNN